MNYLSKLFRFVQFVVLSKKWFSSKNFDDVRTTPLKLTNKGAPGSFFIGSEKTIPEETTKINLKENTLVSMVESKGGLLFVWCDLLFLF
jgi:hypothetical protein